MEFLSTVYIGTGTLDLKGLMNLDRYINDLPPGLPNEYLLCACVHWHIQSIR